MNKAKQNGATVDVICQHSRDGTVIPIKIRVVDDYGEYQTYHIQSYRTVSAPNRSSLPDNIIVTNSIIHFECKIITFDTMKKIQLCYNSFDSKWKIYY